MTKKCNHLIGFIERDGYDGAIETNFKYINDIDLEEAHSLKSQNNTFHYCANCGYNLVGLLDRTIEILQEQETKMLEEEKQKKEASQKAFEEKVIALSKLTKLDQLPENKNFVIIFHPTYYSSGKDVLVSGKKDEILRSCAQLRDSYKDNNTNLIIKNIYEVLSPEEFFDIMKQNEYFNEANVNTKYDVEFIKKTEKHKTKISLSSYGTVYVSIYDLDDSKYANSYDMFSVHRLAEYLKTEIKLKELFLS